MKKILIIILTVFSLNSYAAIKQGSTPLDGGVKIPRQNAQKYMIIFSECYNNYSVLSHLYNNVNNFSKAAIMQDHAILTYNFKQLIKPNLPQWIINEISKKSKLKMNNIPTIEYNSRKNYNNLISTLERNIKNCGMHEKEFKKYLK